jgi:hypothetical protein
MGRPLKIKKTTTKDIGFNSFDQLTNPVFPVTLTPDNFFGVVGGANASVATASYPVVACTVNIPDSGEDDEAGFIIRQKGATKYLVQGIDSGDIGVCTLVNDATPGPGEMSIGFATGADSTLVYIKRLTNKWALDFNDVRYLTNFFSDEGDAIKSGTIAQTVDLAQIESYTS